MMRVVTECQEEIERQLDVALILKKILFFERAISKISFQTGIETKSCYLKRTLDEVKISRLHYENEENVYVNVLSDKMEGIASNSD